MQGDVLRRRQFAVVLQARAVLDALEAGDEQQRVPKHVWSSDDDDDEDDDDDDDDARKKNLRVKSVISTARCG